MKKFQRMLALLLVAMLAVGMLAGCGEKSDSKEKEKEKPVAKDCKGLDAVKAWQDMEEADYVIHVDDDDEIKGDITVCLRKNAFSVSVDFKNVDQVKGEVLRVVEDTVYVNLSAYMVDMLKDAIKQTGSEDTIYEVLDDLDISIEEGWIAVFKFPEEMNPTEYVYDFVQAIKLILTDAVLLGEDDDETIVVAADKDTEIVKLIQKHVEKDVQPIVDHIMKDLKKVDYVGYVKDMFTANKSLLEKYVIPMMIEGGEMNADALWDMAIDAACQALQVKAEDKINEYIYDMLDEVNTDIMVEDAFVEELHMDKDVSFKAELEDGVLTVSKDAETFGDSYITVTANDEKIKAPKLICDLSDSGLIVIAGVLAPSYLKYINKAQNGMDIANVQSMVIGADAIAADVEYDLYPGDEFLIFYEDGELTLEVQGDDELLREATDAWRERCGVQEVYELKSKALQNYGDGYAVGILGNDYRITWEKHGEFFDAIEESGRTIFR